LAAPGGRGSGRSRRPAARRLPTLRSSSPGWGVLESARPAPFRRASLRPACQGSDRYLPAKVEDQFTGRFEPSPATHGRLSGIPYEKDPSVSKPGSARPRQICGPRPVVRIPAYRLPLALFFSRAGLPRMIWAQILEVQNPGTEPRLLFTVATAVGARQHSRAILVHPCGE
jgi:hypothetical protein